MLRHMMFFVGWDGLGWGGDGNVPRTCTHFRCFKHRMFLALAHMVDATAYDVFCWVGWVGVGWGWQRSSYLHTFSMLQT